MAELSSRILDVLQNLLQITHRGKFRHLLTSLANKYKPSLPVADVLVREE